jgi:hypothetical protein
MGGMVSTETRDRVISFGLISVVALLALPLEFGCTTFSYRKISHARTAQERIAENEQDRIVEAIETILREHQFTKNLETGEWSRRRPEVLANERVSVVKEGGAISVEIQMTGHGPFGQKERFIEVFKEIRKLLKHEYDGKISIRKSR